MKADVPLLMVEGLEVRHHSHGGAVNALNGVSFSIARGQTIGLVGESGCGKSTLAKTIVGLYRAAAGRILFSGADITPKGVFRQKTRRRAVTRKLQMVFQDPLTSLNPRSSIGRIIEEPMIVHRLGNRTERKERVAELLGQVGLSPRDAERMPHEFSGGQRQRVGIARALALTPELIICDEPVSALDLSVQAQVLNLLSDLQARHDLSYLFISHDLNVVRHMADRVMVMYLGRIVESGPSAGALGSAPASLYPDPARGRRRQPGSGASRPSRSLPANFRLRSNARRDACFRRAVPCVRPNAPSSRAGPAPNGAWQIRRLSLRLTMVAILDANTRPVIATPTDFPDSPLSKAIAQPMMLGVFLNFQDIRHSTLPTTSTWTYDYNGEIVRLADRLGFEIVFSRTQWLPKGGYDGEASIDSFIGVAAFAPITRNASC